MSIKSKIAPYIEHLPSRAASQVKRGATYVYEGYREASTGTKVAIALGVGSVAAFAIYELYQTTQYQGAGCTELQKELASVIAQQFTIYNNAVTYHQGTMTASQQSQITTLQKEQTSLVNQIGKDCNAPVGTTLTEYLDKVITYASWVAIALIAFAGIVLTARALSFLRSRWGGSVSNPGNPPTSPDDSGPPSGFQAPSVNMDYAGAQTVQNVNSGVITPEQGTNTLSEIADTDPVAVNSTVLSDYAATLAEADAALAELEAAMDALAVALDDALAIDTESVDSALAALTEL